MARPSLRYGIPVVFLMSAVVLGSFSGCRTGLATLAYLIRGNEIKPEYKYLEGKKVAVLVRPEVDLQYRNPYIPRDLAKEIGTLLKEKVPKIEVVDQQKVNKWCDENNPEDLEAFGKAMKADMVVSVGLQGFDLFRGQTIYQGRAVASIQVFDFRDEEKQKKDKKTPKSSKDNRIVFEKQLPESIYPPNSGVPTSDMQEPDFRRAFVRVLADQIARHFYSHDAHSDFAKDSTVLN